jgi:hypothetical protein
LPIPSSASIALERNDTAAAKERLIASAKVEGPNVNLAPNLTLAQDLLEAGERAAVLEFLEKCRAFWRYDQGRLDHLKTVAKSPNGDLLANWFPEGRQLIGRPAPAEFKSGDPTVLSFSNRRMRGVRRKLAHARQAGEGIFCTRRGLSFR